MGDQTFRAPEAMFVPVLTGRDIFGIHELTYYSITRCDMEIRNILFGNIILSGGNTMFKGMAERLYKEVNRLAYSSAKPIVLGHPQRNILSWIGGSMFSTLSTIKD